MNDIYDETHLGTTYPSSPLLLWLTVDANYHSGDKHQFAAFLKAFKDLYGGEDDNQVAALYVLGDNGPVAATWDVEWDKSADVPEVFLIITCDEYEVSVTKQIQGWF